MLRNGIQSPILLSDFSIVNKSYNSKHRSKERINIASRISVSNSKSQTRNESATKLKDCIEIQARHKDHNKRPQIKDTFSNRDIKIDFTTASLIPFVNLNENHTKKSYKPKKDSFKSIDINFTDKCKDLSQNIIIAKKLSLKRPTSNYYSSPDVTTKAISATVNFERKNFTSRVLNDIDFSNDKRNTKIFNSECKNYQYPLDFNFNRKSREISMSNNNAVIKMKNMPKMDEISDQFKKKCIIDRTKFQTEREMKSHNKNMPLNPTSRYKFSEEIYKFKNKQIRNKPEAKGPSGPYPYNGAYIDNLSLLNRNKCFEDAITTPRDTVRTSKKSMLRNSTDFEGKYSATEEPTTCNYKSKMYDKDTPFCYPFLINQKTR